MDHLENNFFGKERQRGAHLIVISAASALGLLVTFEGIMRRWELWFLIFLLLTMALMWVSHIRQSWSARTREKVKSGSRWKVTGENGDWTEIRIGGKTGYIASTQIRMGLQFEKAISIGEEKRQKARAKRLKREAALIAERQRESLSSANLYAGGTSAGSALQKNIVSFALQFVGNPYVWGGVSLTNGCDCSGFVMKIYEKYGYRLPHYSASQAGCGRSVSLTALEPGDLVFYRHGGRIGHVAMYIGNGRIVHAKSKKDGIVVTDVNYAAPYCAVRLV